ncbi:ABC transporter substrate-binding protein [Chitinasiproducens palmae]|uniref:Putative spermidine/putrescine transport system substrate-binding protein n=1 Tax=Chitinasiproducens palmae TaxID=1770053 RepID=A0A1H2PPP1_9BURK|nr:ABC transporter substrate-binding protein [Chitinasiproducens palmae]SDV48748.1 putative spermidine/putrescine transport system substrate-binding protein [Chitinasiproducens palmae]
MDKPSALDRRRFLLTNGALLAGSTLAPLGFGRSQARAADRGRLVYAGFGGSYERAVNAGLFAPFAKETGIDVTLTTGGSDVAKIRAMVRSGRPSWDLVDAQGATLGQFINDGLLEPIDSKLIANADLFDRSRATAFSVPWYQFSLNLFWNPRAVSGEPASWADVWDVKKFPGKRGLSKLPWFSLEIALLADGVPLDKLYPLDVDRAFASLDRIRPHAVFLDTNSLASAISSQELVIGIISLARIKAIQAAGVPLRYTWQQALTDVQQLVVLKGAPDAAQARQAIAYALRPEPQKALMDSLGCTPVTRTALARITPERARDLAGTDITRKTSFYLDAQWWGKHGAEVGRRWQDWLAA